MEIRETGKRNDDAIVIRNIRRTRGAKGGN